MRNMRGSDIRKLYGPLNTSTDDIRKQISHTEGDRAAGRKYLLDMAGGVNKQVRAMEDWFVKEMTTVCGNPRIFGAIFDLIE